MKIQMRVLSWQVPRTESRLAHYASFCPWYNYFGPTRTTHLKQWHEGKRSSGKGLHKRNIYATSNFLLNIYILPTLYVISPMSYSSFIHTVRTRLDIV